MTVEPVTGDLQERVRYERRIRGWSIRRAAVEGSMSNTLWGAWERSDDLPSNTIRHAVANAFDWPPDWPEDPPPVRQPGPGEPSNAELAAMIQALAAEVARMGDAVEQLVAQTRVPPPQVDPLSLEHARSASRTR